MASRRRVIIGATASALGLAAARLIPASADRRRLIIDSQVHLWPANTAERPWVAGAKPQLPEPFTIERVVPMMDAAGVDRVMIVPPTVEGERLDYAQEAVKRFPARFGIMARIPIDKPDRAQRLTTLREEAGVLGVRLNFDLGQAAAWLTDGTADWFWPAAEKAALPIMFLTSGQTPLFARIAERHPQLTLILDHMGVGARLRPRRDSSGVVKNDLVPQAIAEAAALARYPNVSVKLSSVPLISTEAYPFRDTIPHIQRLFDAYGPRRCHWGSDITNSLARATYRQRVTQFTEELTFLSEEDKDWIMGGAIVERLDWA